MTNKFDTLNDEFNVAGDIVQPEVVNKKIDKIKEASDDIKKDYDYTRGNLYSIIEKVKKQSMAFLSWHKKVRCQEHMKLLVN